jgi:uncharacterized protein with HEPN domain
MRRRTLKFIFDAHAACDAIQRFTSGKSLAEYRADDLIRSAVERQFTILGEAFLQADRLEPDLRSVIADLPKIIGFRNVLVHGYDVIQDDLVWQIIQADVPALQAQLQQILDQGFDEE